MEAIRAGLERLSPGAGFDLLLVDPPDWIEEPGVGSLLIGDRSRGWKGSPELWSERLLAQGIGWTGSSASEAPPDPDADREAFA